MLRRAPVLQMFFGLLLWLTAAAAVAQSNVRPALHWARAASAKSCIDPRALALRVTALTGNVLVEPTEATLSIEGHVEATADGHFVVRIGSSDAQGVARGERTIEQAVDDCRKLDDAIAFVIALLIDPDLALEKLPREIVALGAEGPKPEEVLLAELEQHPPREVALSPRAKVPAQRRAAPAPPRANAPLRKLELSASAAASMRELPRTALGGQLGFAYVPWRALAFEAQLRALKMVGEEPINRTRSLAAHNYAGAVLFCPRTTAWRRAFLEGCAGAELSATRMSGRGFSDERTATLWGAALQLAGGAGARIHERVAMRARATVRYSRIRQLYRYESVDERHVAFESPHLAVGLTIGMSVDF